MESISLDSSEKISKNWIKQTDFTFYEKLEKKEVQSIPFLFSTWIFLSCVLKAKELTTFDFERKFYAYSILNMEIALEKKQLKISYIPDFKVRLKELLYLEQFTTTTHPHNSEDLIDIQYHENWFVNENKIINSLWEITPPGRVRNRFEFEFEFQFQKCPWL